MLTTAGALFVELKSDAGRWLLAHTRSAFGSGDRAAPENVDKGRRRGRSHLICPQLLHSNLTSRATGRSAEEHPEEMTDAEEYPEGTLLWTRDYVRAGYPPWPCETVKGDETVPGERQRVVNYGDLTYADVPKKSLEPFLEGFAKSWRAYTRMSKAKQNSAGTRQWQNAVELCLQNAKVESKDLLQMVKASVRCLLRPNRFDRFTRTIAGEVSAVSRSAVGSGEGYFERCEAPERVCPICL